MNKCLCIGLGVMMALSSCTTITHTSKVADIDTRIYNLTVAELDVKKEKAEATAEWKWTPFSTFDLKEAKNNVTADALKSAGGDVLVEPQFQIKRRGFLRGGSISVSGYPATYKNFHSMTPEEAKVLNPSTTVVAPEIYPGTGLAEMKRKKKAVEAPLFTNKKMRKSRNFINVLFGPSNDLNKSVDDGSNLGIMYGVTGTKLGAYVKVAMFHFEDYYGYDEHNSYAFTVGVVKPFSNKVALFAGLGFGSRPEFYMDHYYDDVYSKNRLDIPIELGLQFSFGRISVVCGYNYSTPIEGAAVTDGLSSPFVGLGYVF